MTEKQIRTSWWIISGSGFVLIAVCFLAGFTVIGGLVIFPITLLVRHIVTGRWYPNRPN